MIKVNESNKISILHLSDIHFKVRKKKDKDSEASRENVKDKMFEAIGKYVKKYKRPDFVAITGDISFDGKMYNKAEEFFDDLKVILPDSMFLPVPGNHDVDRDKISEFFSLYDIVTKEKMDNFLKDIEQIKQYILPKFKNFTVFSKKLNPDLYKEKNAYFWVNNVPGKNISFLGLNSAWACEGDEDCFNIALGFTQVSEALKRAETENRILLMHHPPFNWLKDFQYGNSSIEVFKNCSLILCGHIHADRIYFPQEKEVACICLAANASYTNDKEGFIGFQFLNLDFTGDGLVGKVWPYILDKRRNDFVPDRERYRTQDGKDYFLISSGAAASTDSTEPITPLKIPRKYREWIEQFHSTLSIEKLSKKGEVIKVSLPELYIHIETANPFYKPEKDMKEKGRLADPEDETAGDEAEGEPKEPAAIDIERLLSRVNCILLRGAAGMGKTTLIKHLAYTLTHAQGPISLSDCLPVLVFMKDLWPVYEEELHSKNKKITFESLLETYLVDRRCPLNMETVTGYLAAGRALFLLDGLDEVPDYLRPHLIDIIAEFQFAHNENRFLITGRPHGIERKAQDRFGKDLHDINPLDEKKVYGFISDWFRSISGQAIGLADRTAADMIADVKSHRHISEFTGNPLLLTAVCILYQDGKHLPEQRADLYERIVGNLIYKRFHDPADPDKVGRIEEYLMHLAFVMQSRNLRSIEVSGAVDQTGTIFPKKEGESRSTYRKRMERLFDDIEPKCGLLNRSGAGEVEFYHLTFQEFLAGRYMIDKGLDYKEFLKKSWWQETILLYIGLISLSRKKDSNDIVKEILETGKVDQKDRSMLYLLAGRALRDIQVFKRDDKVVALTLEKLIKLIDSGATLEERFEAGEILGSLGDPRIHEDNMIKVEAGEFTRGSESKEVYDWEKPVRTIYLDEYMIGKYQVTNEEYRRFVEDGGYANEDFWAPEGWQWKEKGGIIEPRYWHDRKWNGPNFPVVGVSWYEACAYAEWLSKTTGEPYRLPTEAEWEKAARGTDGRTYPWGEGIDKKKCNYNANLGRTSPVGIFPQGTSPYGCFDMAGNVWEWCSDWFDEKYYEKSPDKNPQGPAHGGYRVLRGGSWFYDAGNVRAAFRYGDEPSDRWSYTGFRLSQGQKMPSGK
ncbi:MAG: SUMF1/EgtB/PvdO family nonheme iron enzyme [Candidatus Aminicenantes bacterium]|nr:SUMF1/EgtB/PvdO family nonheme iron enzyme [Candidatus Aminicenantes bacterium]